MNKNIDRLKLVDSLFNDLINDDLKYNFELQNHILGLVQQIKSNINFLLIEYYFTNIIEFESVKKKIINMLIITKNIFYTFKINNDYITKINNIKNIIKLIIFPAHLNINNTNKYVNEISKKKKIKFYHKQYSMDIKDNFNDEEIDMDEKDIKLFSSILIIDDINNKHIQNNKNCVINKLKGNNFYNKIDFIKSHISI